MYLKKIDLLGFKSFSDKTCIQLEKGISCIVGPNGSGKSNIADALRWVFGEQSAKTLRGGKLEDVIFSGSKSKRSLGMAEVSITLDNSDGYLTLPFSEIVITRRVFRSGQSEYLLNNQQCRLKDIQELFVDSGMGLDGVSLIGQDKIYQIINAKPEERRFLVEETAGILKYRYRKKEAVRKFTETEHHLERVGDIICELEDRLEPLAEQAKVAAQHIDLTKAADRLEIALAVDVLGSIKHQLDEVKSNLQELNNNLLDQETEHLKQETQLEEVNFLINNLEQETGQLQQQFQEMITQKEALSTNLKVLFTKQEAISQNRLRLREEVASLEVLTGQRQKQLVELCEQIERLTIEVSRHSAQISSSEGDKSNLQQTVLLLEAKLSESKDQAFTLAETIANHRNQVRYQEQLLENNHQSRRRLEAQKEEIRENLAQLARQREQRVLELDHYRKEQKEREDQLVLAEEHLRQLNNSLHKLMKEETDCRYRQHALASRIHVLEEMSKKYEGFFPGVRSILQAKQQNEPAAESIIGVVASLLEVPQEYNIALEACLGSALQNVVAETEKAAQRAIAYLKKSRAGRATFLPLDALRVRPQGDFSKVLKMSGVCGRASELVSCKLQLEPIVDFLLGNTLVVTDLTTARTVAKKLNYRYSVVTLEGDISHPGGTLSGGSRQKRSVDLLSKKTELQEARQKLANLEEEIAQGVNKLTLTRQKVQEKEQQIQDASQQIKINTEHLHELQKQNDQTLSERKMHEKQLQIVHLDLEELHDNQEKNMGKIREKQADLLQGETQYEQLLQTIEVQQQELVKRQTLLAEGREDLTVVRVELARMEQDLANLKKQREILTQERENGGRECEKKSADLLLLEKELEQMTEKTVLMQEQLLILEQDSLLKEENLKVKKHDLTAEMACSQELQVLSKKRLKEIEELKEKSHRLELKKTRLESEMSNEEAKLMEKFRLTFAQACLKEPVNLSRRGISLQLQELKKCLQELGTVNVLAIDEYREVTERYDFLRDQRDDLLEAMTSLQEIISEMDSIISSRFKKAFERLSKAFNDSFVRLFDGGAASLLLNEPDNILETGVEMIVQPPGKKVVNYNLLSGGEKSLVGIAFLFAVLSVRPTPFCVMDEVDAALDEANVDRFADYLADLSQDTQFLLISHRQGTMESAASLWGVTMGEDGVSKLISVRLEDQLMTG
ncbi:MAG: chromosome segregation protein SMC [Bacillota bacterium]|jgi:chromosome segregation protein